MLLYTISISLNIIFISRKPWYKNFSICIYINALKYHHYATLIIWLRISVFFIKRKLDAALATLHYDDIHYTIIICANTARLSLFPLSLTIKAFLSTIPATLTTLYSRLGLLNFSRLSLRTFELATLVLAQTIMTYTEQTSWKLFTGPMLIRFSDGYNGIQRL